MKRSITIFLFLLAVATGLQAQTTNIANCRLMKVWAILMNQGDKDFSQADPPLMINFALCYGGKSSGYVSSDYIYLVGDDSDTWKRYGCMSFMDMPKKVRRSNEALGNNTHMTQCIFWGDGISLGLSMSQPGNGAKHGSANYVLVSKGGKNYVNYMVVTCDFYDISTGQERLVLEQHVPGNYNYNSAGNLFRTFMNNMYDYYSR